jgi:hypothetical protein
MNVNKHKEHHMKKIVAAAALSMASALCMAGDVPSKDLVERYFKATQTQKMTEAQVDGYADQYAKGKDAAYKSKVRTYLNSIMGWDALKDEYAALVQETYSEKEIKAALTFMESPIGRSMSQKGIAFSNKMSAIAAKRAQQVAETQASKQESTDEEASADPKFLSVSNVEEMQSGETTYFTGQIHNNGKAPARGINIEANLFLGQKFVDQYSAYVTGAIPPGGVRFFKISCGCKGNPPAKHDSYKIEILNGY